MTYKQKKFNKQITIARVTSGLVSHPLLDWVVCHFEIWDSNSLPVSRRRALFEITMKIHRSLSRALRHSMAAQLLPPNTLVLAQQHQ